MELTKRQRNLVLSVSGSGGLSLDFMSDAFALAPDPNLALATLGAEAGLALDFTDNSSAVTIPASRVQAIVIT